jgi:hypothetical protein
MTPAPRLRLVLVLAACALGSLVAQGQVTSSALPSVPLAPDAPFTVAMNTATIEGGPVYVADNGPLGAGFRVINGGVRNLVNGGAHAATNAETQMLLVPNPKIRILMTLAEGLYRVVAKRSAGIATVADLRGKRITVPPETSAHYFLVRTLVAAGLAESDVNLVNLPRGQMWAGVVKGPWVGCRCLPGQQALSGTLQPLHHDRRARRCTTTQGTGGLRPRIARGR